ncbi:hypothetical protein M0802_003082 [Mischocyttarus mexicanus]|nr:hypothetical protein M0802_003082 [Mischocyttarus mexicanus]
MICKEAAMRREEEERDPWASWNNGATYYAILCLIVEHHGKHTAVPGSGAGSWHQCPSIAIQRGALA